MSTQSGQEFLERLRHDSANLNDRDFLKAMIEREFSGSIAVTSSFGAEAAVLLDLVAQISPSVPVIFLDTDALFDETIDYQRLLSQHLGLTDVRIIRPDPTDLQEADDLWRTNPDRCCHLRKVLPIEKAISGFRALIDGRKRNHGAERAGLERIEQAANGTIKISPLAHWSAADIERAFLERGLPRHPLTQQGYASIGCWPCTRPIQAGEDVRAGRWAGSAKSECGIHKI